MSYLVFALGALLSLCGAFAISSGYGIIQVERGWAGVIAGATALSGGIVTIALGFILHSLSGLQALHKTEKGLAPSPRELGEDEAGELRRKPGLALNSQASMVSDAEPPPAAMPSAASSRSWPQRPTRPNLPPARSFLKARGAVLPAARAKEPQPESGVAVPGEVMVAKAEDEAKTPPASAPAMDPPAESAWDADYEPGLFDDDKAKDPPIEAQLQETHFDHAGPETDSGPRVTGPAEMASSDAIFGEDHLVEPGPARDAWKEGAQPSLEAIETASLEAAPPSASEALPAADSPPAAPAASEAGLAIVGRYESEGTSYVMRADGSIEARSERGVFHFQSMAELKAFMEAQA